MPETEGKRRLQTEEKLEIQEVILVIVANQDLQIPILRYDLFPMICAEINKLRSDCSFHSISVPATMKQPLFDRGHSRRSREQGQVRLLGFVSLI